MREKEKRLITNSCSGIVTLAIRECSSGGELLRMCVMEADCSPFQKWSFDRGI